MADNFTYALLRTKAINDAFEAGLKVSPQASAILEMMSKRMPMKPKPKPTMKPGKGKK